MQCCTKTIRKILTSLQCRMQVVVNLEAVISRQTLWNLCQEMNSGKKILICRWVFCHKKTEKPSAGSARENLDLGRVYGSHYARSVLMSSVTILPFRPPFWLTRTKYLLKRFLKVVQSVSCMRLLN